MKKVLHLLSAVALLMAQCLSALAQSDVSAATLKGTVSDPQSAVVANAKITVTSVERGNSRNVTSNEEGAYQIPSLQPGTYQLRIEAQGFETIVVTNLILNVEQFAVQAAQMKLGSVSNVVDITTAAPVIEVERTQQSNTIESRQIENLPNIGRAFTGYVFTLPGVSSSDAPRVQGGNRFNFGTSGFSIGGANGRTNLITVDG